ncbi:MAG: hypothetical protein HYX78_15510 [Armatimonadetes bacterium]|nr:hypothetical protein [Armatimonadota bacterium]
MAEAMTKEKEVAEQAGRAAKRGVQRVAEGEPTRAVMEVQEMIPVPLLAYAAGASILASAILFGAKRRDWSLFVGQWVPTFLLTGLFYKLLRPSKE